MVKMFADYAQHVKGANGYGYNNLKKKVTVHQTANLSKGANARMHANLQKRVGWAQSSWHWTVDETQAIQSFKHSWSAWHASTKEGNTTSIGVELCVHKDGNYKKTIQNGAYLVAWILHHEGLGLNDVLRHYDWCQKWCPAQIMDGKEGIDWPTFKQMVETEWQKMKRKNQKLPHFNLLQKGEKVRVGTWATHYHGGKPISEWVKASSYFIDQVLNLGPARSPSNPSLSPQAYRLKDSQGTVIGDLLAQDIVEAQPAGRKEEEIKDMNQRLEQVNKGQAKEIKHSTERGDHQFILEGKLYEVQEVK